MATDDFFRARLDTMIDMRHPLAVLATRMPWAAIEAALAPVLTHKTLTEQQRRWLKRRQAIEPAIGHAKHDNRMDRCWLQGAAGDALHAVLCAAGFNIRWLLRAVARLGLAAVFLRLHWLTRCASTFRWLFAGSVRSRATCGPSRFLAA